MADIIRVYTEQAPRARLIGRRYGVADRGPAGYAHKWMEWFEGKRFQPLEALVDAAWKQTYPEAGSYLGLMRWQEGGPFEYWIGLALPPYTPAPDGYEALALPEQRLGVCWVKGVEPDIYQQEEAALEELAKQGLKPLTDPEGWQWMMERYQCPRFTGADEAGTRVLDLAAVLQPEAEAPVDLAGKMYCAACRQAYEGKACPECGHSGTPLRADDPIYIGELPGRLRNALQIAFGAGAIPFNALATLGSGFTLSAGDIFETYKIYVPYERAEDAKAAFQSVFDINNGE